MSDMFGVHPSDDELADLAAEVLPPGQARDVEAHVVACSRCADLLADSERVRRLLLTDDPGPMPDDVWNRIELSLAAEVEARYRDQPGHTYDPSGYDRPAAYDQPTYETFGSEPLATGATAFELGAPAPWDEPLAAALPEPSPEPTAGPAAEPTTGPAAGPRSEPLPEAPTSQWNRFVLDAGAREWDDRARTPAPDNAATGTEPAEAAPSANTRASHDPDPDFDDEDDEDAFTTRHTPPRPRLPVRPNLRGMSNLRSRRDVRDEDRVSPLVRYGRPLGIAAGVLGIAALAGYAVTIMPGGGNSSGTAAGGAFSAASQEQAAPVAAGAAGASGAADRAPLTKATAEELLSATGTKYTTKDFATQAMALPQLGGRTAFSDDTSGGGSAASPAGSAAASAPAATVASPVPAPNAAQTLRAASKGDVAKVAGNKGLLDPAVLAGCLAQIGRGGSQPIAVDLATYDGADAAIVVFAGPDGGYEVFVVRRSCGVESADALAFKDIPAK